MPFSYEKITTHFGHIFPTHIEELCELLIILRKQFSGDLDLMLILAIIGSRTLPARHTKAMTYDEFITDDNKSIISQPINIQSVAECSGIARETVRRKVNKLEALGYVTRNDHGMLKVTPKATTDLTASTEASIQYLVALGASGTAFAHTDHKESNCPPPEKRSKDRTGRSFK
ncbi:DeoR family transcriptional regulator [Oceanisphaera pacifica]|uniref:DeoR family transcriptional regulator n=1 Tax=Oceanisphaera pacifica TaxID=2818389 RepID=A0ABS3NED2_9GAMM|nr:DeoR family transcriptional regulator [Oceanisphaera pacifica]MBO1518954.1 DeoR family transcriptional regulator [Oceanisphaera pacifica]